MNYIQGASREQALLFPEVIEEYITEENPVRFMDAFVGELDLRGMGFSHTRDEVMGRPSYDPGDLLRLYIYGYLHRIRSSRLLEKETGRNVELMWLMRKLKPDFKTIADFRKDNLKAIKGVCREFTLLCKKLELFGGELLAVDGSKFKAVNSKSRNFSEEKLKRWVREIDEKIDGYIKSMDRADTEQMTEPQLNKEALQSKIQQLKQRKGRYGQLMEELKSTGSKQISLTDKDSRAMLANGRVDICYNVQTAVDNKHKLIVEHEVVNDPTDLQQLSSVASKAKETLGVEKTEVVADMGYYHGEKVKECLENGITPYVAKPHTSANTALGLFGKEKFVYDKKTDCYICPAGSELTYRRSGLELGRKIRYYRASACASCAIKPQCTRNKDNRRITRWEDEHLLEEMERRVKAHPEKMKFRKCLSEHPFGTIKRSMNAGYFLMKGLDQVRTEMSLSVLAYNLKRAINILGVKTLMEALT